MKFSRRLFHMAIAVVGFCFGSFAYAATDPVEYGHVLSFVLADVGAIGTDTAKFHAEQAYMITSVRMCNGNSGALITDSHGFMQVSADEVAKGTTGSTVSHYLR